MATIVCDCPRCGAKSITFDILSQNFVFVRYDWMRFYEIYSRCRKCLKGTVFVVAAKDYSSQTKFSGRGIVENNDDISETFENEGFLNIKDLAISQPPEFLSPEISAVYREAVTCFAVQAYNGAGTMFRLCLDLATEPLLPPESEAESEAGTPKKPKPNSKQRRDLGLRIAWLLDNNRLPESFRELAQCVREDANDGAHVGNLSAADAEDLQDFTFALLERLITEPERLKKAQERRVARRAPTS
ncbi:MAG: DUF4145 domain-containing protein [Aestuariivirga sp.]